MTNITKQQAQRAISLIRAAQNTDYIEAMLDTLSRFIEQSTEPGEPSRAQLDAAWEAFQAHPVDHAEDSDDQQRLCVESAVRAAFRSIESSVLARQGVGSDAEWLDIETAPKDGTPIIGFAEGAVAVCSWEPPPDNPVAAQWGLQGTWHRREIRSGKDLLGFVFRPTLWTPAPGSLMKAPTPTTDGETR